MNFPPYFKTLKQELNSYMEKQIGYSDADIARLIDAARYSVTAGGKRIRGISCLKVGEIIDPNRSFLPLAAAIEFIHVFSLIHDDLPAMDNDDYRRGKQSNHKVYGEDMAILSGDYLLIEAIQVFISNSRREGFDSNLILKTLNYLLETLGKAGMVGGQVMDITYDTDIDDVKILEKIHLLKTAALLRASLVCPVIMSTGKENIDGFDIGQYADQLGLLFQIVDDILDETGDQEVIGKPVGSDRESGKATYVTLMGLEKAREYAKNIYELQINVLKELKQKALKVFLTDLLKFVYNRTY